MGLRFEFDRGNQVLLVRAEGRLTDELLAEAARAIRSY
jgi:Arc/MetJ family transcription regulator